MPSPPLIVDPDKMFRGAGVWASVEAVLAVVASVWLHVPMWYLVVSLMLGALWFLFTILAWRSRRRLVFVCGTVMVLSINEVVRSWLVPHSLFSLMPGLLVTTATQTALVWRCQGWVRRVCRLCPSAPAA